MYRVGDIIKTAKKNIEKGQIIYKSQSDEGNFRVRVLEGDRVGQSVWVDGILPDSTTTKLIEHAEAPKPYTPKVGMKVRFVGDCCDGSSKLYKYTGVINKAYFKDNYDHKIQVTLYDENGKLISSRRTCCIFCTIPDYPQLKLFSLSDLVKGDDND